MDIADNCRIRRIATAAPTGVQQQLLAAHIPVYDAEDDAVARVLASGLTEVARRTPTGPGPWHDLGVTGYLCVPLIDRALAFGALTLLTTAEQAFDGHAVALAEERPAAPPQPRSTAVSTPSALPLPASCKQDSSCLGYPLCPAPKPPSTTIRAERD